jgi:hypothetical protein
VLLKVKVCGKYKYILNSNIAFNVVLSQLNQVHTFNTFSLKSTLIISYRLRLGFPSVLFLSKQLMGLSGGDASLGFCPLCASRPTPSSFARVYLFVGGSELPYSDYPTCQELVTPRRGALGARAAYPGDQRTLHTFKGLGI